jgi:hypothetical protein
MYRALSTMVVAGILTAAGSAHAQSKGEWYRATGKLCSTVDVSAAKSVEIKAAKYNAKTMISPDSAKLIALCAVPGRSAPAR